ncbi:hypothetical protein ACFP63_15340 [Oerskovia jenensis]|uniref:DUF7455 domain-containing protein n=1 Tax=Oerskovia jenensis TaxID=162169 RepID=A0ABS2LDJ0_9CELL|nr:hypothetical protein [Oerskovia jenensis]MBM7478498.1 hypothetical protein [Oerskovia jenensis]
MNHLRRPWEPPDADPHDALDRCDQCDACGATACVRVTVAGRSQLLFCDPHYRAHEGAIVAAGYAVRDERRTLDEDIALALALARALDSAA